MSENSNESRTATAPTSVNNGASNDGRVYWRSLEQLAETEDFQQFLHREFPENADQPPTDPVSRRRFMGLVAAAVAMASTTACRKPYRKILPFSKRPEDLLPGVPRHYATSFAPSGYGIGVLVRSNDGRPTKVEGNTLHPASLGGADARMQAELLNLYDPARSTDIYKDGEAPTGADAAELKAARAARKAELKSFLEGLSRRLPGGDKLAFLMGPTTSPAVHHMVAQVKAELPKATFHTYSPVNRDSEIEGSRLAFDAALDPQYAFDAADVVVALDSDFMGSDTNGVRHARDFASRRRPTESVANLNRLYAVESSFSVTGSQADHHFRVRAHEVADVAMALAAKLGVLDGELGNAVASHKQHGFEQNGVDWIDAIAKDLLQSRGKSLVVAGPRQPAAVHAVAHAINAALGNVGKTIRYIPTPDLASRYQLGSLRALTLAMEQGRVDTLIILGGNPAYDAPVDLAFDEKLTQVPNRVHLGHYRDETAALCNWHVNAAHDLESWGDIRAYDGTVSIMQPLIAPLFDGMTAIELLAAVADYDEREGYNIVRYYWEDNTKTEDFGAWWNRALHDGLVHDSAVAPISPPAIRGAAIAKAVVQQGKAPAASAQDMEITFYQDPMVHDGRYANNAWMQECPDPITKLTWDNAALMSQKTAGELGVKSGDVVTLAVEGRSLDAAAWVLPGQADYSVAIALGYGREVDGFEVAKGAGFDSYKLRGTDSMSMRMNLKVSKTGGTYPLTTTQDHGAMEGRPLYRAANKNDYAQNPSFAPDQSPLAEAAAVKTEHHPEHPVTEKDLLKSLWTERDYTQGYQWGMVIDLNSCNGCNACVVACQSENNIPTVGKEQVAEGREMHWLRIDRYFTTKDPEGSKGKNVENGFPTDDDAELVQQPVPCMQCENAPCESVCPVAATTHSPEGLNDMAYNRCIGTRYCSNNCPYKVRKFNWFDFIAQFEPPTMQMMQNPDVTVRNRGVMEKCTYCVQRINRTRVTARNEKRGILDGEVQPACAQSCPSQAITFGNIVDKTTKVAQLRSSDLNYAMLSELNVKPRTTYLAKIRNPNPELS